MSDYYHVFSSAQSLLLAVLSPASPSSSVALDAAIAVGFASEEDRAAFAVRDAASDEKRERCLVRPGRRNVNVIAAPSGCARAGAPTPA